jgi:hypothetical protein
LTKIFLFFVAIIFVSSASAEYRVYQYLVKNNDPFAAATLHPAQYIISTLNPQMFQKYHGGELIKVDLLRTWMCPGYTGKGRPTCNHPYDKEVLP